MFFRLLLLLILVPLLELFLLLELAHYTSPLLAFLTVIITGVVGSVLAHHQGLQTVRKIQDELSSGRMPTSALMDGALILVAGALLLTPGLLTDAVGVSLLIPPARKWYRRAMTRWFRGRFRVQSFAETPGPEDHSQILDAHVVNRHTDDDSA